MTLIPESAILLVDTNTLPPAQGPVLSANRDGDDLMRRLKDKGYQQITLCGLGRLGARLLDGTTVDAVPMFVEEDAAFLAAACREAEQVVAEDRPAKHHVYLSNGEFEIVAHILKDNVRVRVGEFVGRFEPSSEQGVTISIEGFSSFWRSISWQLARAAASG